MPGSFYSGIRPVKTSHWGARLTKSVNRTVNELLDYEPPMVREYRQSLGGFICEPVLYASIHSCMEVAGIAKGLKDKKVLEVAPYYGPYMHYLQNQHGVNITGLDLDPSAVKFAQGHGLNMVWGDATKLPFADGSFDIVISRAFLDYLLLIGMSYGSDTTPYMFREKVIMEISRVLKPGGYYFSNVEQIDEADAPFHLFSRFHQIFSNNFPEMKMDPVNILLK